MEDVVIKLEACLSVGDFVAAAEFANDLAHPKLLAALDKLERVPAERIRQRAAAGRAEVSGHAGDPEAARRMLMPWFEEGSIKLDAAIPARARLQAAEYAYSNDDPAGASVISRLVLADSRKKKDWLGAAAAAHALMRYEIRSHGKRVGFWTDRATEFLRRAARTEGCSAAVRWRLGLVMLASGFASRRIGDGTALSKLQAASALLADSRDLIARAHVHHAIGTVLRATSKPGSPKAALRALDWARVTYRKAKHHAGLARVWTTIGRTHMDAGPRGRKLALDALRRALEHAQQVPDTLTRRRHEAEPLAFLSWLHAEGVPVNAKEAHHFAKQAMDAAPANSTVRIEAALALGTAELLLARHREAESYFRQALESSTAKGLEKTKLHAHLCLARLYVVTPRTNVGLALEHLREADTGARTIKSRYLDDKLASVRRTVGTTAGVFMITRDQLFAARGSTLGGFKGLEDLADDWIVDQYESTTLSLREKARRTGTVASNYKKKLKARRSRGT